eukprot:GEMP01078414.1.p1 GENE.GEMP01078414.1~~GEMP01078414.1.p1  ORF type:complete len:100 (+),score=18.57 GEMP01078414.1:603-902(+)
MVRVVPKDGNVPFAFAGVHLKAGSPDLENVRVQQLSNFFTALEDFARGQRIMLCADLNNTRSSRSFAYVTAMGLKCAYTDLNVDAFTHWAGWKNHPYRS